ncbi:toll/interleukin-1 receptor domain-containing protein [Parafrankia discariae]|uniref:toll/interleukin-1 receptor domain-containing protein n=1 Tax=Parafrankia discariae TaxID=365528 RepID=UPI0003A1E617|nr:TIR domain-containing protein [Parafrankia discariae]
MPDKIRMNSASEGSWAEDPQSEQAPRWDFFISYTQADRQWAEWVAWQLERVGWRVLIQAWDFVPGTNWFQGMEKGVAEADRTIALISEAYLDSEFGRLEFQSAIKKDPSGLARKLVPIRVADCRRPGLLGTIVSFDLFGLPETHAAALLLEQVEAIQAGRAKPPTTPAFPGPRDAPAFTSASPENSNRAGRQSPPLVPYSGNSSAAPEPCAVLRHGNSLSRSIRMAGMSSLCWSGDGRFLATVSGREIHIWDTTAPASPQWLTSFKDSDRGTIKVLEWSPDRRWLASGSETIGSDPVHDGWNMELWDMADPARPASVASLSRGYYRHDTGRMCWSPDARWLLACIPGRYRDPTPGMTKIALWDTAGPTGPGLRSSLPAIAVDQPLWGLLQWSPDGRWLVTSLGSVLKIWDMENPETPAQRAVIESRHPRVIDVSWSPDGRWLATGGSNNAVGLWDLSDPAEPVRRGILTDHRKAVRAVSWSPDGRWLASGGDDRTVRLWDLADPAEPVRRAALADHRRSVGTVSWSPDHRLLATGGVDGTVLLWEPPS